MFNLKNALMLSDKGYSDLKKAIAACTLTNVSLMIPFIITIQIFAELLKPVMERKSPGRICGCYSAWGS